ncbi:MAG: hypothetical protein CMJ45_08215 [Planctomyces sp.]|nr:hypothetical protein [Planctomyces sp.]
MTTSHQQVHVGPRDGSRYQPVIALVNTGSTYAVMPSPMLSMLGIDPYWTGMVELGPGGSEERSFAEIRLRIGDAECTVVCVFGQQDSQPVLGSHTLQAFGLQVDTATGGLVPARAFLP